MAGSAPMLEALRMLVLEFDAFLFGGTFGHGLGGILCTQPIVRVFPVEAPGTVVAFCRVESRSWHPKSFFFLSLWTAHLADVPLS